MNTLTYDLDNRSLKAKFIPPDHKDLLFLLDTGADVPVWCKGISELRDIAPDAEIIEDKFLLGGFGVGAEVVDVYRLGTFSLFDGTNTLCFHNLIVAVTNRPMMDVDFVLPLSIFRKGQINIDRLSSVVTSTVSITTLEPDIHVFLRRKELSEDQMKRLQIDTSHLVESVYMLDESDIN